MQFAKLLLEFYQYTNIEHSYYFMTYSDREKQRNKIFASKWKIYAYVPLLVKYVFRVGTLTATRALPNYRSSVVENLHVSGTLYVYMLTICYAATRNFSHWYTCVYTCACSEQKFPLKFVFANKKTFVPNRSCTLRHDCTGVGPPLTTHARKLDPILNSAIIIVFEINRQYRLSSSRQKEVGRWFKSIWFKSNS